MSNGGSGESSVSSCDHTAGSVTPNAWLSKASNPKLLQWAGQCLARHLCHIQEVFFYACVCVCVCVNYVCVRVIVKPFALSIKVLNTVNEICVQGLYVCFKWLVHHCEYLQKKKKSENHTKEQQKYIKKVIVNTACTKQIVTLFVYFCKNNLSSQ